MYWILVNIPSRQNRLWDIGITISLHDALRWRHNERDSVSNHQPHHCLLNRLFRRRPKKISKLRVTGLCAGNSPGTGEFPAQMASNAENVWWRHPGCNLMCAFVQWGWAFLSCWMSHFISLSLGCPLYWFDKLLVGFTIFWIVISLHP